MVEQYKVEMQQDEESIKRLENKKVELGKQATLDATLVR